MKNWIFFCVNSGERVLPFRTPGADGRIDDIDRMSGDAEVASNYVKKYCPYKNSLI